ncbi:hypothetical protein G3580_14350 [Nitrogeniibacter mangrovi]|uniref:NarX-like N-terminal domain-containing protein n=1 Tax=Nitrogeniibacter mangrovi TaxID=2016596 RepID=A0A6C1B7J7_9RHOO|nr:type IV pili methyl-accepting chemotaxis transducer N-terminal domain-containing protein [Nitrogeniibacter mangrovi]QID18698.1 hypothetical protein G3580_14350 [Nitrogeniibacter mangrovi]
MSDRRDFLGQLAGAALALSFPFTAGAADEAPDTVARAVAKAGRQRMLAQRCAKAWLMQALGVMPDKAGGWLAESVAQFDRELAELKVLGSTAALGLLVRLNADWRSLKNALAQAPGREAAIDIFARADAVLNSAEMATQAYEKLSGTRLGWLISTSGRQSMLSQRAADFVFFNALGVETEATRAGLARVRADFADGLAELKEAPENTSRINNELALAEQQWILFEGALADSGSPRALRDIATTSELMLRQLTVLDDLYAALPLRESVTMSDG